MASHQFEMINACKVERSARWEHDNGRTLIEKVPYVEILPENNAGDRWLTSDEARDLVIHLPIHLAEMVIPRQAKQYPGTVYRVPEAFDVINSRYSDKDRDHVHLVTLRKRKIHRINNTGWRIAKKAAGLNDIREHDLRRRWASWHLQAGTTIDELIKIGGWASPEIVRKHYAHLAPEQLRTISENVRPSLRAVK